nr:MAG TPA: hypothetical protein [Caudoviricetes sp.]
MEKTWHIYFLRKLGMEIYLHVAQCGTPHN